ASSARDVMATFPGPLTQSKSRGPSDCCAAAGAITRNDANRACTPSFIELLPRRKRTDTLALRPGARVRTVSQNRHFTGRDYWFLRRNKAAFPANPYDGRARA